jgi:hypothetical protein
MFRPRKRSIDGIRRLTKDEERLWRDKAIDQRSILRDAKIDKPVKNKRRYREVGRPPSQRSRKAFFRWEWERLYGGHVKRLREKTVLPESILYRKGFGEGVALAEMAFYYFRRDALKYDLSITKQIKEFKRQSEDSTQSPQQRQTLREWLTEVPKDLLRKANFTQPEFSRTEINELKETVESIEGIPYLKAVAKKMELSTPEVEEIFREGKRQGRFPYIMGGLGAKRHFVYNWGAKKAFCS